MPNIICKYTKGEVNQAGKELGKDTQGNAKDILDNWRACHVAPLNAFQTSLREKLTTIDTKALVSQRLKRSPSIISKLERNPKMRLARMQDIGGIRAVVNNMQKVRKLEASYKSGTKIFQVSNGAKDYINYPKTSGYRSIHLIFKCKNGYSLELQIRTQIQHAWATAIETMGTFLSYSLKSGEGPKKWLDFFALASSAFAILENTPRIPTYDLLSDRETFEELLRQEKSLNVIDNLSGFKVAARHIKDNNQKGHYHLVTLNLDRKRVNIQTYSPQKIKTANEEYSKKEAEAKAGENIQVVLVSSESITALKKSYPSYFLDSELFVKQLKNVRKQLSKLMQPQKI